MSLVAQFLLFKSGAHSPHGARHLVFESFEAPMYWTEIQFVLQRPQIPTSAVVESLECPERIKVRSNQWFV